MNDNGSDELVKIQLVLQKLTLLLNYKTLMPSSDSVSLICPHSNVFEVPYKYEEAYTTSIVSTE